MKRPLYNAAVHQPTVRGPEGHAGLWFDKFCDRWRVTGGSWTMSADDSGNNPKLAWIQSLAEGGVVGIRTQIEEIILRLVRLVERRGGWSAVFTTESRFVTGLGRSHPVENGFAWHPTLGTPYLPGSSIKGLVRAWAREHAESDPTLDTMTRLLGGPGRSGSVCFLDAVPTAPAQLEADVMTPHYAGWSESNPPGDWCSPSPIPFLVTAAGTSFLFGLIPCCAVVGDDLDAVFDWLRSALLWAGGGAKTAIGYGRFRENQEQTNSWVERVRNDDRCRQKEEARLEAMGTPEGRWRLKIEGRSEAEILELVRMHLEKEPLADPIERRVFARAVLSTDLVKHWRRGRARDTQTNVGKKKLKERASLLDEALNEVD
ncbi:MAG: type III-B CRISPR module RAMP protein Cmr6 [Armatimonadetes bacterium]|nr:type III-B CRISPR module RAMP protein Cmr6 [Armatimonadota bacterium]